MKKLISFIALCAVATPAFADAKTPRPSYLKHSGNGNYDVTYNYADKAKSGWYGSLRAELSFLNFKNEYYVEGENTLSEKFDFEPVFAADLAFGKRLNYFWRAEVEAGYINEFSDSDEGYEVKLSVPYLMANGYYDFDNGLYVGAGAGIAVPKMELLDDAFVSGNNPKWSVSPMFGLMAGWSYKLDDNMVLDMRYRIAGFWGTSQERQWKSDVTPDELADLHFKNKIGLVLDNSVSIGIRYEF